MITRTGSTLTLTLPSEEIAIGIEWLMTQILAAPPALLPLPPSPNRISHPSDQTLSSLERLGEVRRKLHQFDSQNPTPPGEFVKRTR